MSQTNIEQDDLIIEALDFEYAPPCEYMHEDCDRPSEWFWTLACCGQMYLLCETHHQFVYEYTQSHSNDAIVCVTCGHEGLIKNFYLAFGRI